MNALPPKNANPLDNDEMLRVLQQSLTKKRVLLVDRHPPARDSLRLMLGALGVTSVHGAGNSAEVIRQVKGNRFDIILSDFVLDDGRDGQQLLEELRHAHLIPLGTVYMIITSERGYTNVVALAELAPDDYLIKPFDFHELLARTRALLRRGSSLQPEVIEVADMKINIRSHEVRRAGNIVELTAKEYALLEYLARQHGQVVSRSAIAEHVWDENFDSFSNLIEVYIQRLRRKIDDGCELKLIRTLRGEGYMLAAATGSRDVR